MKTILKITALSVVLLSTDLNAQLKCDDGNWRLDQKLLLGSIYNTFSIEECDTLTVSVEELISIGESIRGSISASSPRNLKEKIIYKVEGKIIDKEYRPLYDGDGIFNLVGSNDEDRESGNTLHCEVMNPYCTRPRFFHNFRKARMDWERYVQDSDHEIKTSTYIITGFLFVDSSEKIEIHPVLSIERKN